jgi:hypothetical protein
VVSRKPDTLVLACSLLCRDAHPTHLRALCAQVNFGCLTPTSWPAGFSLQMLLPFIYSFIVYTWAGLGVGWSRLRGRPKSATQMRRLKNKLIAGPLKFLTSVSATLSSVSAPSLAPLHDSLRAPGTRGPALGPGQDVPADMCPRIDTKPCVRFAGLP